MAMLQRTRAQLAGIVRERDGGEPIDERHANRHENNGACARKTLPLPSLSLRS